MSQQIEQSICVFDPRLRGPVRLIYVFFDSPAVEPSVRKAVDGEDVAILLLEPTPKFSECFGVGKFARGLIA